MVKRTAVRSWFDDVALLVFCSQFCSHLVNLSDNGQGNMLIKQVGKPFHELASQLYLEPIRITRQREKRSGYRRNGEMPGSSRAFCPSAPAADGNGSSTNAPVPPPNGAL